MACGAPGSEARSSLLLPPLWARALRPALIAAAAPPRRSPAPGVVEMLPLVGGGWH